MKIAEGAEPEDSSEESKDPMIELLKMMSGKSSAEYDKLILTGQVDASMERTLKMLQILWHLKELKQDKLLAKLTKHYTPAIELLSEGVDQVVQDYQNKYGEI